MLSRPTGIILSGLINSTLRYSSPHPGAGFYIDSLGIRRPSASARDTRRILKRLYKLFTGPRPVRKNIWVWSPFVIPLQRFSFIRQFNKLLLSTMLKFSMKRLELSRNLMDVQPINGSFIESQRFWEGYLSLC